MKASLEQQQHQQHHYSSVAHQMAVLKGEEGVKPEPHLRPGPAPGGDDDVKGALYVKGDPGVQPSTTGPVPYLALGTVQAAIRAVIEAVPEGKGSVALAQQAAVVLAQARALDRAQRQQQHAQVAHFLSGGCSGPTHSSSTGRALEGMLGQDGGDTASLQAAQPDASTKIAVPPLPATTEERLMKIFSVSDQLSREEVRALAVQAECTDEQVSKFFAKLKGSVRSYLQRLQKRHSAAAAAAANAAAAPQVGAMYGLLGGSANNSSVNNISAAVVPSSTLPAAAAGTAAAAGPTQLPSTSGGLTLDVGKQQADEGWRRISAVLAPDGGLHNASAAGVLLANVSSISGYEMRSRCLCVVLATGAPQVLQQLCGAQLLRAASLWLRDGAQERQITFLRLLFKALRHLPVPLAMLRASGLQQAVAHHMRDRHQGVALDAKDLCEYWRRLELTGSNWMQMLQGDAGALLGDFGAAAAPSVSPQVQPRPVPSAPVNHVLVRQKSHQPSSSQYSSRPLTADEVVKARNKARSAERAGLPSGVAPSAKRVHMASPGDGSGPGISGQLLQAQDRFKAAPQSAFPPALRSQPPVPSATRLTAFQQLQNLQELDKSAATSMRGPTHIIAALLSGVTQYNLKIKHWIQKRARRHKEEHTRDAMLMQQTLALAAMQPWRSPPPLSSQAEPCPYEGDMLNRPWQSVVVAAGAAPAAAGTGRGVRAAPASPPRHGGEAPAAAPAARIPWDPVDALERVQHNEKLWASGVRLPSLASLPERSPMPKPPSGMAPPGGSSFSAALYGAQPALGYAPSSAHVPAYGQQASQEWAGVQAAVAPPYNPLHAVLQSRASSQQQHASSQPHNQPYDAASYMESQHQQQRQRHQQQQQQQHQHQPQRHQPQQHQHQPDMHAQAAHYSWQQQQYQNMLNGRASDQEPAYTHSAYAAAQHSNQMMNSMTSQAPDHSHWWHESAKYRYG